MAERRHIFESNTEIPPQKVGLNTPVQQIDASAQSPLQPNETPKNLPIVKNSSPDKAEYVPPPRMCKKQTRIFLWAAPRSTSTIFFRAMMNRRSVEVLLEPFAGPYIFGPERICGCFESQPIKEELTFDRIKALCENPYSDYDMVFVKDMAKHLMRHIKGTNLLPEGYIHTFIIRNPKQSIYSYYKMATNRELTGSERFDVKEIGFTELYQMFEFVTKKLGQEAIIVDSDDLLAQPEEILRLYCGKCGIEFEESMLNWDDTHPKMALFQEWLPYFEVVVASKKFEQNRPTSASANIIHPIPEIVQTAINENMFYYEALYSLRLKPNIEVKKTM